jgi:hypothetical protein
MKRNLFEITEEERNRILQIHESATKRGYLREQEAPASTGATTPTTGTTTPTTGATTPTTGATQQNKSEAKVLNDSDYVYKKEGDKYFFKLQANPASEKAKKLKAANRYVNWTEAKTDPALGAIKALKWGESEGLAIKPAGNIQTNTTLAGVTPTTGATTTSTATGATTASKVTSSSPEIMADLKTASEIRQEFRQGKRDTRKLQRQYNKMYNTYNRLSDKMDKATDDQYLTALSNLKTQLGQ